MAQYINEDLERNFKKIFGEEEQVKAKKALSVKSDKCTSEYDSKYTNEYKWTGYGKSL